MLHDLVGGDPHLKRVHDMYFCMCFGTCCVRGDMECLCEECDCGEKGTTVTTVREPQVIPPTLPSSTSPAHTCVDCGVEVFRNGSRGRFPSRCPSCKEK